MVSAFQASVRSKGFEEGGRGGGPTKTGIFVLDRNLWTFNSCTYRVSKNVNRNDLVDYALLP